MSLSQNFDPRKIKLAAIADKATHWIGSTSSLVFHTLVFIVSFLIPALKLVTYDRMLLILTTLVSLEAIYLAIFIQMSVNKNSQDIEIIQEDVGEIQDDIEEMQEDMDELQEDREEELGSEKMIEQKENEALAAIQSILLKLQEEIEALKKK